jgi:hypothetical protein
MSRWDEMEGVSASLALFRANARPRKGPLRGAGTVAPVAGERNAALSQTAPSLDCELRKAALARTYLLAVRRGHLLPAISVSSATQQIHNPVSSNYILWMKAGATATGRLRLPILKHGTLYLVERPTTRSPLRGK